MVKLLSNDELEQLKQFRLSEHMENSEPLAVEMLLSKERLTDFLKDLQIRVHAPDSKVAASMFAKRYGFFAVLTLYAMSVFDKRVNTSLPNIFLDMNDANDIWLPKFMFGDYHTISPNHRGEWREETVRELFSENIDIVINNLSKVAKVSKIVLWENIAIYIFWLYERLLTDKKFQTRSQQIREDFDFLLKNDNGALFGTYNQNPISRYYHEKTYEPLKQAEIRIRSTCCLFFKTTKGHDRCLTCPVTRSKSFTTKS